MNMWSPRCRLTGSVAFASLLVVPNLVCLWSVGFGCKAGLLRTLLSDGAGGALSLVSSVLTVPASPTAMPEATIDIQSSATTSIEDPPNV